MCVRHLWDRFFFLHISRFNLCNYLMRQILSFYREGNRTCIIRSSFQTQAIWLQIPVLKHHPLLPRWAWQRSLNKWWLLLSFTTWNSQFLFGITSWWSETHTDILMNKKEILLICSLGIFQNKRSPGGILPLHLCSLNLRMGLHYDRHMWLLRFNSITNKFSSSDGTSYIVRAQQPRGASGYHITAQIRVISIIIGSSLGQHWATFLSCLSPTLLPLKLSLGSSVCLPCSLSKYLFGISQTLGDKTRAESHVGHFHTSSPSLNSSLQAIFSWLP